MVRPVSLAAILSDQPDRIPARPTVYKGIGFRSYLESRFAWYLDDRDEDWIYEPRSYGGPGHGYLPDFEIVSAYQPTFIELKPTRAEVEPAQDKMSVIWDTHPDALLIVACAEGRAFFAAYRGGDWVEWRERWSI